MDPEFTKTMNAICEDTPKDIQPPTDDKTFERKSKDLVKLFRVSDASGSLEVAEVGCYPLKRELLDPQVRVLVSGRGCALMCCVADRMPSFWTLVLEGSLLGWGKTPHSRKRKLPSRTQW